LPINNLAATATAVRAAINWEGNDDSQGYYVVYKEVGETEWSSEEVSFLDTFYLDGLTPETTYEVAVSTICSFKNRHTSEAISISFRR